jgi:hypothetical protein
MKKAVVKITGKSPISFGRYIQEPKRNDESYEQYGERTWIMKLYHDSKGIFITPMMFRNALTAAAGYLSEKIPNGRGKTYKAKFQSGIFVNEPAYLGIKPNDKGVEMKCYHLPADGKRGGTTRVPRYFPEIQEWETTAEFLILDDCISKDVFMRHLQAAGDFIGVGRFRPACNGYYGRFDAKLISWK